MAEKDPAKKGVPLPWWPRDWAADEHVKAIPTSPLGWAARGMYRELLDHQWLHGSVPADLSEMRQAVLKSHPKTIQAVWSRWLHKLFIPHPTEPGRLINGRLHRERLEVEEYRAQQKVLSALGVAARKAKKEGHPAPKRQARVQPIGQPMGPKPKPNRWVDPPSPILKESVAVQGSQPAPAAPPPAGRRGATAARVGLSEPAPVDHANGGREPPVDWRTFLDPTLNPETAAHGPPDPDRPAT